MKILKFEAHNKEADNKKVSYGVLEGETIKEIEGDIFGEYKITDKTHRLENIKWLPPTSPSKIIAIGLNYRDHAEEMGKALPNEPRIFLKPGTSIIGHQDKIKYPGHMSSHVDYEGELAVVIKKKGSGIKEPEALDYVLGYTCLNDVTARDLQAKDIQFTRAKGFDTFAPFGPLIETEIDPFDLEISTCLNGERKQHSRTSNLLFGIPKLISFISNVMTLLPGDLISTGTPSGVGPIKSGDKVEVEIEGIGKLINFVE